MSIDVAATDRGYVLCVGLSLEACGEVARLVKDRAVVVAAADTDGARALLGPDRARSPSQGSAPPGSRPVTVLQRGPLRVDMGTRVDTGVRFAANASYALRKSPVAMQIA